MHKGKFIKPSIAAMAILLASLGAGSVFAADGASSPTDNSKPAADSAAKTNTNATDQITTLKQQMEQQQKQIEQMQKALAVQKQLLDQLNKAAAEQAVQQQAAEKQAAQQKAKSAGASQQAATPQATGLGEVASTTPIIPATKKSDNAIDPSSGGSSSIIKLGGSPGQEGQETSPLQLHIGDATLTPVGFMDFTSVFRSNATTGSIGTNFANIPYGTSYQTNLSEFRLSMQNSRIGFRTDADVRGFHVIGYMEADFLGNNGTNVAVTSNSNTLRSRLYWVDLRKGGWEILGGQTWSLITPGRVGISPLPADVFYTQDMDTNYQLGLFWARNPELRFVYHLPSDKAAFAVAIDNPNQYIGGSSGAPTVTLPSALSSTYASQLDESASSGGLATPNVAPDIIAKLALDPDKHFHFEVGGVARFFKVWYPGVAATTTVAAIPAQTFTTQGSGGFLNINAEIFKGFRLLTNNFWSDGGGRYIFGIAPDVVANANGSITPVHSASTVTGFEATARNTLIFGYYGGVWIGRAPVIDTNGHLVGYGYAGSSSGMNRTLQEITFGFNQTIWKHPRYGAVNIIGQYSYLVRDPWYVAVGSPANANINMLWFDLRYTLPGSAPTLGRPAR